MPAYLGRQASYQGLAACLTSVILLLESVAIGGTVSFVRRHTVCLGCNESCLPIVCCRRHCLIYTLTCFAAPNCRPIRNTDPYGPASSISAWRDTKLHQPGLVHKARCFGCIAMLH